MSLTIYHNPRCSKSRQTLALLTERGLAPKIVAYLEAPPSVATLRDLLKKLGLRPRDLLRTREVAYKELQLADPAKSDGDILAAMTSHPILIERPIVVNGAKAALGRPPEQVLEIL